MMTAILSTRQRMNAARTVTPKELGDLLLNIGPARPVFIWGPPGIGKSSIVQESARAVGGIGVVGAVDDAGTLVGGGLVLVNDPFEGGTLPRR